MASEQQVQHYDAVHQRYVNTRTHYHQTLAAVKVAKYNLKVAKNRLAASLTRSYKSGNQDPVDVHARGQVGERPGQPGAAV